MTLADFQQALRELFRSTGAVVLSYAMRLWPRLPEQGTVHWIVDRISLEDYPARAWGAYTDNLERARALAKRLPTNELVTGLDALSTDLDGVRGRLQSFLTECTDDSCRQDLATAVMQYATFIAEGNATTEEACRALLVAFDACLPEDKRDSSLEAFGVLAISVEAIRETFFLK